MTHKTFFASCPKGVEEILEKEVLQYGEVLKTSFGGVSFRATYLDAIKFILSTRFSSRVFLQIETYYIENEKDLYEKAVDKWWHKIFELNQTFKITTHTDSKSRQEFSNSLHTSRVLKDAIADSFRKHFNNKRPFVETQNSDISLLLRIEKSKKKPGYGATVSLDLCGGPTSNRGYRESGHIAPLRENLAAAMIELSDWPNTEVPLYDPMCGSGTILIEALMRKKQIPPSFLRVKKALKMKRPPYAFFNHLWFKKEKLAPEVFDLLNELINDSQKNILKENTPLVLGNDIDEKALELTRHSLEKIGIPEHQYKLTQKELKDVRSISEQGVLITNPPYGKRLEEIEQLKETYQVLGEVLKESFTDHRAFILTSEPELSKEISLKSSRKIPLFNGNLDCRLLSYEIFKKKT